MPKKIKKTKENPLPYYARDGVRYGELKKSASSTIRNNAPVALGQKLVRENVNSISLQTLFKASKELNW
jgi:hypothetical protein